MITLIVTYLPYFLFLYFVLRFFREPIFLLGVPFLMFFRYCILFENVKFFWIAGRLGSDMLLLIWLLVFGVIISIKSAYNKDSEDKQYLKVSGFNLMDYLVLGLSIVTIIGMITVQNQYYNTDNVFIEFFTMLALFVGYFIVKHMVRYTDPEGLAKFLFSIVVINSIASLLYLLHQGFHMEIYTFREEATDMIQGEVITRTFWFMPILWFFSIAYLLVFRKKKSAFSAALIVVNMLAIFISYTRSFLIIALLIFIVYYMLTGIKKRDLAFIVKNLILIGIAGVMFFIVVSYFLPASTNFFIGRFVEMKEGSADEESNTLVYRFARTEEILDKVEADKALIGFGPVTQSQSPLVDAMEATTADLVWTGVVFRWGYIGFILFVLLYVISLLKAFSLFMNSEGIVSQLALLFLLVIISQVIEGFTAWTFLSPSRFALGLWYFGMLSALIQGVKNDELLMNQEQNND